MRFRLLSIFFLSWIVKAENYKLIPAYSYGFGKFSQFSIPLGTLFVGRIGAIVFYARVYLYIYSIWWKQVFENKNEYLYTFYIRAIDIIFLAKCNLPTSHEEGRGMYRKRKGRVYEMSFVLCSYSLFFVSSCSSSATKTRENCRRNDTSHSRNRQNRDNGCKKTWSVISSIKVAAMQRINAYRWNNKTSTKTKKLVEKSTIYEWNKGNKERTRWKLKLEKIGFVQFSF